MVEIRDKQELLLSSDDAVLRQQVSLVLECMREELDDHRLAINENTAEQESSYEFLNALNRKVDKLTERIDELTLLVKGAKPVREFVVQPLTAREKDVFRALYALTEMQPFASYEQLARKCALSKDIVGDCLTGMVQKGVPVLKKQAGTMVFVKLDAEFRELQTKKNVMGLDAPLSCWI